MQGNGEIMILGRQTFLKLFNGYNIKLIPNFDKLIISIQKKLCNLYESKFELEYFHSFNLLSEKNSIQEIIDFILNLIDQNQIEIQENLNHIKLILISNIENELNVELLINKSSTLSIESMEILINQIELLTKENEEFKKENRLKEEQIKNLKTLYDNKIKEIEEKLNKIELLNNNNLIRRNSSNIKNENLIKKIRSKSQNKNTLKKEIIKEKEQKIKYIQYKIKKENTLIDPNDEHISTISIFPCGNLISVTYEQSIKIYDKNNFNIIQYIEDKYNDDKDYILDISIKDDNNFVTCSTDGSIRIWKKNINKYEINQIISNAHVNYINKIIYNSKGNLISCSFDKSIKIWEENNNNYECIKILNHSNNIWSLLLLDNKNILISSGLDGTKFWDLKDIKKVNLIKNFDNAICCYSNALEKIDENKIIIGGNETKKLKVISVNEKKVIKEINLSFSCYGIKTIKNKGLFLVGGTSNNILIFNNDNFECIHVIQDAHFKNIFGFIELKNGLIASFAYDSIINIWSFNNIK